MRAMYFAPARADTEGVSGEEKGTEGRWAVEKGKREVSGQGGARGGRRGKGGRRGLQGEGDE